MSKYGYKVGDMVRRKAKYLSSSGGGFTDDNGPFRVVAINERYSEVTLDRNPVEYRDWDKTWDASRFELVSKADAGGEYILILKENGNLKPSLTPRTYSTEAQAKAVAASMAEKHPGQEFLIFKAVGKAKAVAATVEMY